jgi:hypothetical protein
VCREGSSSGHILVNRVERGVHGIGYGMGNGYKGLVLLMDPQKGPCRACVPSNYALHFV